MSTDQGDRNEQREPTTSEGDQDNTNDKADRPASGPRADGSPPKIPLAGGLPPELNADLTVDTMDVEVVRDLTPAVPPVPRPARASAAKMPAVPGSITGETRSVKPRAQSTTSKQAGGKRSAGRSTAVPTLPKGPVARTTGSLRPTKSTTVKSSLPRPPRVDAASTSRAVLPPEAEAPEEELVEVEPLEKVPSNALAVLRACEQELSTHPGQERSARLHYEIARLAEYDLNDLPRAAAHFQEALAARPDHLPTIQGARRVYIARRSFPSALPLFDAEARLTSDPAQKAKLLYQKGRFLEDTMNRNKDARDAYRAALDLCPTDATVIKALESWEHRSEAWADLDRTYERSATAVAADPQHRAAVVIQRAQLIEHRHDNIDKAIELYESALSFDPRAPGALGALKRLHHGEGRWRELIGVLEREAEQTSNRAVRAMALYRISRVLEDRLSSQRESITAMERAVEVSPDDPLMLHGLARLYSAADRHRDLVRVLKQLVETTRDEGERLGLLHRVGQVYELRLNDPIEAISWYESALAHDPTYVPVLRALGSLYTKSDDWEAFIRMNLAEAAATDDVPQRAAAHARVAEVFEIRLNRVDDAANHHRQVLVLRPDYPASFKALSRIYAQTGRWRELIELTQRALEDLEAGHRKVAYLMRIAAIYEDQLDEHSQAVHQYQQVLALEPDNLGAIHALQRACERAERWDEMVAAIEMEAAKTTDRARILDLIHRAGQVTMDRLEDHDGALARFRRVLSTRSDYRPALSSLGLLYYRMGRWPDLLDVYRKELDVIGGGPSSVALLQKMGELCEDRIGDQNEALSCYRRAISIDGTYRPALTRLARILRERQEWVELHRVLEFDIRTLESKSASAVAAYRLGEVCEEQLGQPDRAIEAYKRALEALPDYRPAYDALTRLREERKAFSALIGDLEREIEADKDPALTVAALLHQGSLWSDRLKDLPRAIECFEAVLERESAHVGAMLALEPLYRSMERWEQLVTLYERQAQVFADVGARAAALREVVRLRKKHNIGDRRQLMQVWESILGLFPTDITALEALRSLARQQADSTTEVAVMRRLCEVTEDPALKASYQLRLAETLEPHNPAEALACYQAALETESDSFTITHGLRRVAKAQGALEAWADASRHLAHLTRKPVEAAELLVESADIRISSINDHSGALTDLERALELNPESPDVSQRLSMLLGQIDQRARLADLLSRAAKEAKTPTRVAELWLEVAEQYAHHLDNLAGAIAALKRGLDKDQRHLPSIRKLAELYGLDNQWQDAAKLLERVVQLAVDRDEMCQAHLELAALFGRRLNDGKRAKTHLEKVLTLDSENSAALLQLSELQQAGSDVTAAISTARRLVRATDAPFDRARALMRLGHLELAQDNKIAASDSFRQAIAIEGPLGAAAGELSPLIETETDWSNFAEAIRTFLSTGAEDLALVTASYLTLARVEADQLGRAADAIATLKQGIGVTDHNDLRLELGKHHQNAKQHLKAAGQFQEVLKTDLVSAETWRLLGSALDDMNRNLEARLVLNPVLVLGEAGQDDIEMLRRRPARPGNAQDGTLSGSVLRRLCNADDNTRPAEALLGVLVEACNKLYPPQFESVGLSARDKLASHHPIKSLADRLAPIFGIEPVDVMLHRNPSKGVLVEMGEPAVILLPGWLTQVSESEQVFVLSRPLTYIARRVHPALKMTPQELELLLTAAARNVSPQYGFGRSSEEFLNREAKRISKSLSRRSRKVLEERAEEFLAAPPLDFAAWVDHLARTAARTATLLADDLGAAFKILRRTEAGLSDCGGASMLSASPLVFEIFSYWYTDESVLLRRKIGLLPKGVPSW